MKHSILSIVLYNLIASSFAQAMQKVESPPSSHFLEVTDIKPFGAPFTHVPRIVFANPPHRILKLTDESCATIRKAAETVTHVQIRSSVRKQTTDQPLSGDAFDAKCLETAESYDWINAMNYMSEHLQDTEINVAFVKEVNRRLGRLSGANSGEFRRNPLQRLLREFDNATAMFYYYVSREGNYLDFFRKLETGAERGKKFCESMNEIMNDQDNYLRVRGEHISTQSIKELFDAINHLDTVLVDQHTYQPFKLDIHAAEAWELEEKETNPEYKAGYIDVKYWFEKTVYTFCMPWEVEKRLTEAIRVNSKSSVHRTEHAAYFWLDIKSSLHPIEQAAYVWLDIMRINPFNDANKRTARAIATFILLKHGYLPPLLTNDDVEECLKILIANVDPRRGYRFFTQYLARLVKRTQDQYAGQTV